MLYFRFVSAGCSVIMIFSLCFAFYLEYYLLLEPCPLCIIQRVFFLLSALGLVAFVFWPKSYWLLSTILWLLVGAIVAGRHVWITYLPAESLGGCLPGLSYMIEAFPVIDSLQLIFSGSVDCAEVTWTLLSLSIPEWSLLIFTLILCVTLFLLYFYKLQIINQHE
ncbi:MULTISPECIES: disulfide bond formation protein B [Azotobacter]|nr:disulfide bond formation protein B [Azotobacter vinelandii]